MIENYFEVLRPGINTTFQDNGRKNFYHIGIPFSGAMDNRNFVIANALSNNKKNNPVIEFALQGPKLRFKGDKVYFNVTGDVNFQILRKNKIEEGVCYQNIVLENNDCLDLISTNRSVYGYLSVNASFKIDFYLDSCSVNTKAEIGANNGKILEKNQIIEIENITKKYSLNKLDYINSKIENIRVIKGPHFDYFSKTAKGLVKGTIQITADGNPIVMLSDHGTIGGYPKIGVVISADYDKLVQIPPGSKIKFKEINLKDAETIYKLYEMETQNLISKTK